MRYIKFLLVICFFSLGCNSNPKVMEVSDEETGADLSELLGENNEEEIHAINVKETFDASRYTFIQGVENGKQKLIAIPQTMIEVGKTYYYQGGLQMHDFESKELDTIFPTLYLVNGLSAVKNTEAAIPQGHIDMHGGKSEPVMVQKVEPLEDGLSIKELLENPTSYSNKKIMVRGQCVKVNRNIMGKNWVHLQDGTVDNEGNPLDLTVNTQEEFLLGSVVTLEGVVAVDKDFGAGYRYDVILEEAVQK